MSENNPSTRSWFGAIAIGLGVSAITALLMVTLFKSGISPLPKPLGLAFAETLLGQELPLPVGLLFHTAYVTFWSVVYIRFFPLRNVKTVMILAASLWLGVLVLFYPIVGWGVAGLSVSPKLIIASFVPHLLFGVSLWALERFSPPSANRPL